MNPTIKIPYESWQFLYPPRPETAVSPDVLTDMELKGWIGTYKMNGTCSLIGVSPTGTVHTLTRHNTPHKMWSLGNKTKAIAEFGTRGKWTVFLAELLNDKTPLIKDTLYIFDILVSDSIQLIGTTFDERQEFLRSILPPMENNAPSHTVVAPGIWLAKTLNEGFAETFRGIKEAGDKAVEGLVLKNPKGALDLMFRTGNNQGWNLKVRVPLPHSHQGF